MNLTPYADTQHGDEAGFLEFLGAHEMAHEAIALALGAKGKVVARPPLTDDPRVSPSWLLAHQELHRAEASALGTGMPDMSSVDWNNPDDFSDWMKLHADVHAAENAALNIG